MTTYTAITSGQRDAESPIDVTLIGLMIDNPVAITEKAAGAPVLANSYAVEAMLAAASVSQGKLKTTTGTFSTTGAYPQTVTLASGSYGFYPNVQSSGPGANYKMTMVGDSATGIALASGAYNSIMTYGTVSGQTMLVQERYIQASPPYDLGDGKIPLFVFAVMNSDGTIHSTYIAPEAPWHNNGPTNIRPDVEIGGKKYQRRRQIIVEFGSIKAALLSKLNRTLILDRLATDTMVDVEITQAVKQADMPLIPHPFQGNNLTGKTVVLLDPVSPLMEKLLAIHESGESVTDIIRSWVDIGNTALVRAGPPGVMIVNATLK